MHELTHLLASFITYAKPTNFSIIPKKHNGGITLGSVSSSNITWYNAIIVSLAPFTLYFLAYYLMKILSSIDNELYYYLTLYFIANLLFAGTPSSTDWKLAFKKSWILLLVLIFVIIEYKFKIFGAESILNKWI